MFESRPPHNKMIKMKNPQLQAMIVELKKASIQNDAKIWKVVATYLDRSSKRAEVNLSKIDKYSKEGDIVLIPGKVLGMGELTKKLTICAYNFSSSALLKINNNGSKIITLTELIKKNPKGTKVRLLI
ncbi:MAG: 50S ribosomal protein L18e [Candidatus Woesearchaeota archaeon]